MWSVGSEPVDVYLGANEGAVAMAGAPAAWCREADVAAAATRAMGEARAKRGRQGWSRPRVRVWLSGALARPFVWGPVQGLVRWREVELAAGAAASQANGLTGPCAVSLDEWRCNSAALVVAMEQDVRAAIIGAAKAAGLRVTSLRPWWARVVEQHANAPVLTVRDTDALTVLAARDAAWQLAHSYVPQPRVEQTQALLDRLMLASGIDGAVTQHADLANDSMWAGSEVYA